METPPVAEQAERGSPRAAVWAVLLLAACMAAFVAYSIPKPADREEAAIAAVRILSEGFQAEGTTTIYVEGLSPENLLRLQGERYAVRDASFAEKTGTGYYDASRKFPGALISIKRVQVGSAWSAVVTYTTSVIPEIVNTLKLEKYFRGWEPVD